MAMKKQVMGRFTVTAHIPVIIVIVLKAAAQLIGMELPVMVCLAVVMLAIYYKHTVTFYALVKNHVLEVK